MARKTMNQINRGIRVRRGGALHKVWSFTRTGERERFSPDCRADLKKGGGEYLKKRTETRSKKVEGFRHEAL